MSEANPPAKRAGLPWWIKLILWVGGLLSLVGLVVVVLPLAFMLWVMGSGDQVDTRALASERCVAVAHFEPDLADPGVAALLEHMAAFLPEMQARSRSAQGFPEWVTRLETMQQARNSELGVVAMMPTQATVCLEPADADDPLAQEPSLLGAINLPAWGRGLRLGMWMGARMQEKLASDDPSLAALQRVEVGDHTLYVQRSSRGEVFWGALDSTMAGGSGSFDTMVRAMERMDAAQPGALAADLQAALDALGAGPWVAWGAMLHTPESLEKVFPDPYANEELSEEQRKMLEAIVEDGYGEVPSDDGVDPAAEPTLTLERSCITELEGVRALAFGFEVLGSDALRLRFSTLVDDPAALPAAQACAQSICEEDQAALVDSELELSCAHELGDTTLITAATITGVEAVMQQWLDQMEEEMRQQQQRRDNAQLPTELQDIPELEGLSFE
jgi:hypothetical protein